MVVVVVVLHPCLHLSPKEDNLLWVGCPWGSACLPPSLRQLSPPLIYQTRTLFLYSFYVYFVLVFLWSSLLALFFPFFFFFSVYYHLRTSITEEGFATGSSSTAPSSSAVLCAVNCQSSLTTDDTAPTDWHKEFKCHIVILMCVGLFASVKGCFLLVLFFYFPSLVKLHSINLSCWLLSVGSLFLPLLWLHLEGLFGHQALRNCHMNSSTIQLSNAFMARIFGRLISISSAVLVVCVRNEEKEQIQLVWQLQSASRQTAIGRQQTISCWAKTCGWQRLDGVGVFASVKSVWQLLERERLTECAATGYEVEGSIHWSSPSTCQSVIVCDGYKVKRARNAHGNVCDVY